MHLEAKPRSEGRLSSHGPLMGPSRVPRGLVVGIEEPAAHVLRAAVAQGFLVSKSQDAPIERHAWEISESECTGMH